MLGLDSYCGSSGGNSSMSAVGDVFFFFGFTRRSILGSISSISGSGMRVKAMRIGA